MFHSCGEVALSSAWRGGSDQRLLHRRIVERVAKLGKRRALRRLRPSAREESRAGLAQGARDLEARRHLPGARPFVRVSAKPSAWAAR